MLSKESSTDVRHPEIGILAGMGPRSTAPFLNMVITQCQVQYAALLDEDFPAIMVYSLPTPFFVDRPINHERMVAAIKGGLRTLSDTGVGFIAMPCVTAHAYWNALTTEARVPLLNMIDETIAAISCSSSRVALLATRTTMRSGVFQSRMAERGLEMVMDESWQAKVDELIRGVKAGQDRTLLTRSFAALLETVTEKTDAAVVACTDLSVLNSPKLTCIRKVDAAEALAAAVVREYVSQRKLDHM